MWSKQFFSRVSLSWLLWGWATIVALIALNRGIDLLWGVLLVLVVSILIAMLLPKWQLSGVTVTRKSFPDEGLIGQSMELVYEVNATGPFARHGIEIYERLSLSDELQMVAYVPSVRGTQEIRVRWTPQTRGCWTLDRHAVESHYPLGLSRTRRDVKTPPREVVIYPDFVPLHSLPLEAEAHPDFEQAISRRRGGRDEFFGIRDYRPGDEARAVHWRASARRSELVVKEYEHAQDRRIWIFLDLARLSHVGSDATSTLEYMVRIAHSVAVKAHEENTAVGMCFVRSDELHCIEAGADRDTYLRLRGALARVQTDHQPSLRTWIAAHQAELPGGGTWVMFNLWQAHERAAMLSTAAQHHAKPLIVEFDKESFLHPSTDPQQVTVQRMGQGAVYRVACGAELRHLFQPI
jgi:uncharacterized protein (DUF58 family)